MPDQTLTELANIACEAVDRASQILRARTPGAVTMKSDRNPVTQVDLAIEREVRSFLLRSAPRIRFLGEEEGIAGGAESDLVWAFDPVDGTVNFTHGLPLCGISLGLVKRSQPVIGIVDLPFLGERYSAVNGHGAYSHKDLTRIRPIAEVKSAIVSLGDYAVGEGSHAKNADRISVTSRLVNSVERVRMFGSAAVDLAWLATGRIDVVVMLSNKPWDVAAGVLLAREAGAAVTDRNGSDYSLESTSMVACSRALSRQITSLTAIRNEGSS